LVRLDKPPACRGPNVITLKLRSGPSVVSDRKKAPSGIKQRGGGMAVVPKGLDGDGKPVMATRRPNVGEAR